MSNNKSYIALVIISLVIGASGLGIGAFSLIRVQSVEGTQGPPGDDGTDGLDGTDGSDGANGTINDLIGIWEGLSGSGANFNCSLDSNQLSETGFFSLSEGDTALQLNTAGWYRFSISCVWQDLLNTDVYIFQILKNDGLLEKPDYVVFPEEPEYSVRTFAYVYSDGVDIFKLNCKSYGDSFQVDNDLSSSEFILEYVKEN